METQMQSKGKKNEMRESKETAKDKPNIDGGTDADWSPFVVARTLTMATTTTTTRNNNNNNNNNSKWRS